MGRQPSESQRDSTLCLSKNTDLEWLFERFFFTQKAFDLLVFTIKMSF